MLGWLGVSQGGVLRAGLFPGAAVRSRTVGSAFPSPASDGQLAGHLEGAPSLCRDVAVQLSPARRRRHGRRSSCVVVARRAGRPTRPHGGRSSRRVSRDAAVRVSSSSSRGFRFRPHLARTSFACRLTATRVELRARRLKDRPLSCPGGVKWKKSEITKAIACPNSLRWRTMTWSRRGPHSADAAKPSGRRATFIVWFSVCLALVLLVAFNMR